MSVEGKKSDSDEGCGYRQKTGTADNPGIYHGT